MRKEWEEEQNYEGGKRRKKARNDKGKQGRNVLVGRKGKEED